MDRRVLDLGWDVEGALGVMVEVLEERDVAVAKRKVGYDGHLKLWGEEIEDDCLRLQARQAPVARDLRRVHTVRKISTHIVRAGTLCEHTFRAIVEICDDRGASETEYAISEMARRTHRLFRSGLETFEHRNISFIRGLTAAENRVDLLCAEVMRLAAVNGNSRMLGSPGYPAQATLMAHYLERIADHGLDIGLRTVFLVTGKTA